MKKHTNWLIILGVVVALVIILSFAGPFRGHIQSYLPAGPRPSAYWHQLIGATHVSWQQLWQQLLF
ncbi:MAG TPA: hypothetical protein ENJ39_00850 [Flammeovirgaceae bacterium]|nr:hypothetical protein [Flammeovirgaceae bacterium]